MTPQRRAQRDPLTLRIARTLRETRADPSDWIEGPYGLLDRRAPVPASPSTLRRLINHLFTRGS